MGAKTLLIQDLPYSFSKKKIKNHFSSFGTITDIEIDPLSSTCLVTFASSGQANKAKIYGMEWNDTVLNMTLLEMKTPSRSQRSSDPPSPPRDESDWTEPERPPKTSRSSRKSASKSSEKRRLKEDVVEEVLPRDIKLTDSSLYSKAVSSLSEKLLVLEERDRQLRQTLFKEIGSALVGKTKGICPDMCPEKERIMRDVRGIVSSYETFPGSSQMDHDIAVKEYARSSADQEEPLPHELRPEPILSYTMTYLLTYILPKIEDENENKGEWYDFCWGRLRAIRKDIIQQQLCDLKTVAILEQCARFHICCFDFMWGSDKSFFDEKINSENIGNCLQSLLHMYQDLKKQGVECPNEAEFNAYMILLKLESGYLFSQYRQYQKSLQDSIEMKDVVNIHIAFHNNNYSKFFNIVNTTSYLNACLMQRYFKYVRAKALEAIVRSYCPPNKKVKLPTVYVQKALRFDSIQDTILFCSSHGISISEEDLRVSRRDFLIPDILYNPNISSKFVRKKRISIAQAVVGENNTVPTFKKHAAHSSFTSENTLNPSALNASDQKERLNKVLNSQEGPEVPSPPSTQISPPLISKLSALTPPIFISSPVQQPISSTKRKEKSLHIALSSSDSSSNEKDLSEMDVDIVNPICVKPLTPLPPTPITPKVMSRSPLFSNKAPIFSSPPIQKAAEKPPQVMFSHTPKPVFEPPVVEKQIHIKTPFKRPPLTVKNQNITKPPEKRIYSKPKVQPKKEKKIDDLTMKKLRKDLSERLKKVSARKYVQIWKEKVENMRKARLEFTVVFTHLSTEDYLKCWGRHRSKYTHKTVKALGNRNRANWVVKAILETNIVHDLGPDVRSTGKKVVDALGLRASTFSNSSILLNFNPVFWKLVFVLPKRLEGGSTFPSKLRHWCQQAFYSCNDFYLGDVECHSSKIGIPVFLSVNVIEGLEDVSLLKEASALIFVTAQGWETPEDTQARCRAIFSQQSNKVSVGVLCLGDFIETIDFSHEVKVNLVGQQKWLNVGTTQLMLLKLCERAVFPNFKILPGCSVIDKMADKFFDLLHEDKYLDDCLFNALSEPNNVIQLFNSFINQLKAGVLHCYNMKVFATPWEMKPLILRRYPDVKFPKAYDSPEFMKNLEDQFSKLNLPLLRWPIGCSRQILDIFKTYCMRLGIPQIFSRVIRTINPPDDDDPDSDLEYHLICVNWVSIVETVVKELIANCSFISDLVYLDEVIMEQAISSHWWMDEDVVRKSKCSVK